MEVILILKRCQLVRRIIIFMRGQIVLSTGASTTFLVFLYFVFIWVLFKIIGQGVIDYVEFQIGSI